MRGSSKPHITVKNGQWIVLFNWSNRRNQLNSRKALDFVQKLNTQRYS